MQAHRPGCGSEAVPPEPPGCVPHAPGQARDQHPLKAAAREHHRAVCRVPGERWLSTVGSLTTVELLPKVSCCHEQGANDHPAAPP